MTSYEHIAPYYEALFPAREVQLDFFEQARPEGAPARWADVPCGAGAHLEGLADRGLEVRGLDLDPEMLARLRERRADLGMRVVEGDMRACDVLLRPLLGGGAGVLYCVGNSLVQIPDEAGISEALGAMHRLLDPAGVLLIQIVNFDRILPDVPDSLPRIERALPDGRPFALERRFTPSQRDGCLLFETRLETPYGVHERTHELRALTRDRLGGLLEDTGWGSVSWYGDYTRVLWDPASPATIAEARPA